MSYIIVELSELHPTEIEQLVKVWELSVRATHFFLTEENIQSLKPLVKNGVTQVERLLCVRDESDVIQAFIAIVHNKIEMLFIHPAYRGKGIGRMLLSHAIDSCDVKFVDVNEQNDSAKGFYEHLGFQTFSRSENDEQGNPFPILHMKLMN
ncbi:putative N-acetyltransferase YjaB [compost metagenome]